MAARLVSRVFVASSFPDLAKHLRRQLPTITVDDLLPDGAIQSKSVAKRLQEVEVMLCDRDILLHFLQTGATPRLKWAQCASAGIDDLIKGLDFQKPAQDFICTRTGEAFDDLMGEYVVGQIIARERCFIEMSRCQEQRLYETERSKFMLYRPLCTLSIGILGYGTVGKTVASMCKHMGMTVWAVNRTQKTEPSVIVDYFRGVDALPEVLQNCDYICSILPYLPSSTDLLSGEILKNCQERKSVLINIGRGNVISDESIVRAVREGWIGGAILDVFNEEPLPADSELWSLPNVVITPHVSGISQHDGIAKSFVSNLKLYTSGQPLRYVVDWEKGY